MRPQQHSKSHRLWSRGGDGAPKTAEGIGECGTAVIGLGLMLRAEPYAASIKE